MLWIRHAFNRDTQMLQPCEACQLYLPLIVCHAQVEGRCFLRHLLSQEAYVIRRHVVDTLKHRRLKAEVPQTFNVMEILDGGTRAHVPEMAVHDHPIARYRTGELHDQFLLERPLRGQVLRAPFMN